VSLSTKKWLIEPLTQPSLRKEECVRCGIWSAIFSRMHFNVATACIVCFWVFCFPIFLYKWARLLLHKSEEEEDSSECLYIVLRVMMMAGTVLLVVDYTRLRPRDHAGDLPHSSTSGWLRETPVLFVVTTWVAELSSAIVFGKWSQRTWNFYWKWLTWKSSDYLFFKKIE